MLTERVHRAVRAAHDDPGRRCARAAGGGGDGVRRGRHGRKPPAGLLAGAEVLDPRRHGAAVDVEADPLQVAVLRCRVIEDPETGTPLIVPANRARRREDAPAAATARAR